MSDAGDWVPPWDGALYAANTGHHRAFDAAFLATTPLVPTDRVLDLGCGSGDLTAAIAELVPNGHVVGVDAQPSMLVEARTRARTNQFFVESSLQRLDETLAAPAHDGAYDVVTSRAVMQWVPRADWPGVFRSMARLVRPGGWVRVECGGAGNVPRVLALLDAASSARGGPTSPWTFPDAGTVLELLEAVGLDPNAEGAFVRTVAQRRPFDATTLTGWLRSQALHAYGLDDAFAAEVEGRLDELRRHDGTFDQTFVRLDLLARG
jgi:trans-aconitate methyltransferase